MSTITMKQLNARLNQNARKAVDVEEVEVRLQQRRLEAERARQAYLNSPEYKALLKQQKEREARLQQLVAEKKQKAEEMKAEAGKRLGDAVEELVRGGIVRGYEGAPIKLLRHGLSTNISRITASLRGVHDTDEDGLPTNIRLFLVSHDKTVKSMSDNCSFVLDKQSKVEVIRRARQAGVDVHDFRGVKALRILRPNREGDSFICSVVEWDKHVEIVSADFQKLQQGRIPASTILRAHPTSNGRVTVYVHKDVRRKGHVVYALVEHNIGQQWNQQEKKFDDDFYYLLSNELPFYDQRQLKCLIVGKSKKDILHKLGKKALDGGAVVRTDLVLSVEVVRWSESGQSVLAEVVEWFDASKVSQESEDDSLQEAFRDEMEDDDLSDEALREYVERQMVVDDCVQ